MFDKIDHIGHVVNNFDEAVALYMKKFCIQPRQVIEFPEFGSKMAFFPFGGIEIEVIQPGGKGNDPAARCLRDRGEGVFHLSFRVDDYEKEIQTWREKGFTVEEYIHSNAGRIVKLAFLTPKDTKGLWIEFIKEAKE